MNHDAVFLHLECQMPRTKSEMQVIIVHFTLNEMTAQDNAKILSIQKKLESYEKYNLTENDSQFLSKIPIVLISQNEVLSAFVTANLAMAISLGLIALLIISAIFILRKENA